MSDNYLAFANAGIGKKIVKQLGLPHPVKLRRHHPADPLTSGPVLVLGNDDLAQQAAQLLHGWGVDVRRQVNDPQLRWGAVLLSFGQLDSPADLREVTLETAGMLRSLAPHARVITLSRPGVGEGWQPDAPAKTLDPAHNAARYAVIALMRSLAKELRNGATANSLVLADALSLDTPSAQSALRFLLSARSAYVNGQPLLITGPGGQLPADWDLPLAGKVAVVTGAARGIGAAITTTLARDGASVIAVDVPGAGAELVQVANKVHGVTLQLDITSPDAASRIAACAQERFGHLDILVHNAGITRDKLLANMKPEQWDAVVQVNLEAQLRITQELFEKDALSPQSRIISLASTSALAGNRGQTNYSATKAGIVGAARVTSQMLAPSGGTANAVAPGFIETDMTAKMPLVTRQVARRLSALQQGGLPVDVAEAIAFLASPASGGIQGQVLRVCGQNMVGA